MNLIRHYPMPDAQGPCHLDCEANLQGLRCDSCAGQCDAGKRCPRTSPITEPGDLAPEREQRSVPGTGLVISLALVFAGICLGSALALAFNGWPK